MSEPAFAQNLQFPKLGYLGVRLFCNVRLGSLALSGSCFSEFGHIRNALLQNAKGFGFVLIEIALLHFYYIAYTGSSLETFESRLMA